MQEFLEKIAESLRCLGVEATAHYSYINVQGCSFSCRDTNLNYMFLGKRFNSAYPVNYNANKALLELLRRLPNIMEQAEKARAEQLKHKQAQELSRKTGLKVSYYGGLFTLQYTTDTIDGIQNIADTISKAMDDEWDALLKQTTKSEAIRFTAEGGFSLN